MHNKKMTYKQAGVDIEKADSFMKKIKPLIDTARTPQVLGEIGGFGGFFNIDNINIKNPVLVASTDGVGTKLLVAGMQGKFDTVGIDVVAMGVNDIITTGARPLFFLDYFSCGKLLPQKAESVIKGIVDGCKQAECVLLGGETAEMPDMYKPEDFDLVGFCIGVVDGEEIIDGKMITSGDAIIGIQSSGIHSNGFSLIRKIFTPDELKGELGQKFLIPTFIYVKPILKLIEKIEVKSIAHITGGGLIGNIPRVLPKGFEAIIRRSSWGPPNIFNEIKKRAKVSYKEMFKTFNMGIGMAVIVSPEDATKVQSILKNYYDLESYVIGSVRRGERGVVIK